MRQTGLCFQSWSRLRRLGGVRFLLALTLASALSAEVQSAEEDPLPPLPSLDPNQEPPADWSAWLGVPKLLGMSQADITSNWSYSREFSRVRQSDQQHTTVFMELEAPSPEEFIPGSMVWWKVVSANASASIMSSYSSYGLGGGQWTGSEGMTQGSYTGPLSLRVEPRLSFSLREGRGQFSTLGEPVAAWGAESSGTVTESSGNGAVTRSFSEVVMRQNLEASTVHFTAPKAVGPFSGRFFVEGPTGDGTGREGERIATSKLPR